MADRRKSKVKDGVRRGKQGNKKVFDKFVEASENSTNSQTTASRSSSTARPQKPTKALPTTISTDVLGFTNDATSSMTTTSFAETATAIAHSPQKTKPIIKLTQGNTPKLAFRQPPEKTSAQLLLHIGQRLKQPKAVIPGLPQDSRCRGPDFFIMDRRHKQGELIRLPKEPNIKRTPNFVREGVFPFFALPAELRNHIYDHLIESECYALGWVENSRKSKLLTYRLPQRSEACQPRMSKDTLSRRRALKKNPHIADRKNLMDDQYRHNNPVALLWVCKQMYSETSSIFYGKSTFAFDLLGTLRHFMSTLTTSNKENITKLKLTHRAYGRPAKTEHQVWKMKADRAWEDLCWRISNDCISLSHLTLDLDYRHSKLQFVPFFKASRHLFGTDWMIPLWAFDASNLRRCACRIRSTATPDAVLEAESFKIRKELLSDAWKYETEKDKDAFGFKNHLEDSKQKKAVILRITQVGEVAGLA